ncbi:hypothetical protein AB5I41_15960 [Sphingomonas sp. MMS24-JH45]
MVPSSSQFLRCSRKPIAPALCWSRCCGGCRHAASPGRCPICRGRSESLLPTEEARLADWRVAFAAAVKVLPDAVHVVAIRGGALVDAEATVASRWYLAPLTGAAQVRELRRLREASGGAIGGNALSDAMMAELDAADPSILPPLRVARLAADPRPADTNFAAAPPWRSSEPRGDARLAAAMADDIARWIATCAD